MKTAEEKLFAYVGKFVMWFQIVESSLENVANFYRQKNATFGYQGAEFLAGKTAFLQKVENFGNLCPSQQKLCQKLVDLYHHKQYVFKEFFLCNDFDSVEQIQCHNEYLKGIVNKVIRLQKELQNLFQCHN